MDIGLSISTDRLSCENVHPLNNYKAQLVSTVYTASIKKNKKNKIKKHIK